MNITTEFTPDRQAILRVEVEPDRLQRAMQRAAQNISRVRPLPGFRPGKAPYAMVERAVGKELLAEEALDQLSRELYPQALDEQKIEPYEMGRLEIVQKDPPVLKFTIPLRPQVKLGDYAGLHLQPKAVEVTDEQVNEVLNRFQLGQATIVPVEREVRKGDVVTVDITGGVPGREPVDQKDAQFAIGDPKRPGLPFEDQLLGMAAGETRSITFTYPEDSEDAQFRGQTAKYEVTLHSIKETQLPELNDEFAQSISHFQNLDQFKGNVRSVLHKQKEKQILDEFADEVLEAVVGVSQVSFPPVMLEDEIHRELERSREQVKRLGLTWPRYLELSGKTEEEIHEEARPQAEKQLRRTLVLLELVNGEKPKVSDADIQAEIERRVEAVEEAGGNGAAARRSYSAKEARSNLEFNLKVQATMAKLLAMVQGEPVSGKILTPAMVKSSERNPSLGLITDPSQVRAADWPKGL